MDFFNQTLQQARELLGSMTPGARVTAVLLVAVVVVSLAFLFQQNAAGPDEYLFAEPQGQSQIARMTAAMAADGVQDFEIEGNFIRVPRGQRAAALAAIASAGELPADVHRIMSDELDKGSVFDSREVKQQRIKAAMERRLSETIGLMNWVEHAVVIFDERDPRGLGATRQASASVSVMPGVGETLTSERSRNVKALVTKSLNLTPDDVTVTDLSGGAYSGDEVSPDDFDNPLYVAKARIEKSIRLKLLNLLSDIRGVAIEVKAVLDDVQEKRTVEVKPVTQTATLTKQETIEDTEQVNGENAGQPGLEAQGPGRAGENGPVALQDRTKTTREDTNLQNAVGTDTQETVYAGLVIKEAWASVRVPRSHVYKVYRQQFTDLGAEVPDPIDPKEIQQFEEVLKTDIENTVTHQLPKLSLGENEQKQVGVVFFNDLTPEVPPAPSFASNAMAWTGRYWNSIAMGGLALVSLVMLRSIVTSNSQQGPPPSLGPIELPQHVADVNVTDDEEEEDERPKLKLRKADSLKEDLNDMVSTDPEAAAAILSNWINNAA